MKEIIKHAGGQPASAASIALKHMLSYIWHLQNTSDDIDFDALTDDVLIFICLSQSSLDITGVHHDLLLYSHKLTF